MATPVHFRDPVRRDMEIPDRRLDARVPHERHQRVKISPVVEHVRCVGVSDNVRGHPFRDPHPVGDAPEGFADGNVANAVAPTAD